jgi:hypothetical protein
MDMIRLIMSGAVVGQELAAEFGPLPPALLPVGAQRLYELQLAQMRDAGPVFLVLPEAFVLSPFDRERLDGLGVEVVAIPDGLGLGEAVVYALNSLGKGDLAVHILHGDTLIIDPPLHDMDVIVGGAGGGDYSWAEVEVRDGRVSALTVIPAGEEGQARPVAAGYFAFSSSLDLIRAMTRARGDFVGGINAYLADHPVALTPAREWLDFGHLQTFFRSRLAATMARSFNTLRMDGLTARKSSVDEAKMQAEARWLRNAPSDLQIFCGRMIETGIADGRAFYLTEYEYLPVLSELFALGQIGATPWLRIMASCETFLRLCAAHKGDGGYGSGDAALRSLAVDKTFERLETLARMGFEIDRPLTFAGRACPSLVGIAEILAGGIDLDSGRVESVMHGDFCFSNILYSARVRRIKVIDPRGYVDAGASLYGDPRYDLAKLSHSIVGRYDQIIAGRFHATRIGRDFAIEFETLPAQGWLEDALADLAIDGIGGAAPEVRAVMIGLFLSAPALHADRPDRQQAMIANALRLFLDLDRA